MSWTSTDIDTLQSLSKEGLTASQIGSWLGRSRSAVLGKLFRMGLSLGDAYRDRLSVGRGAPRRRPVNPLPLRSRAPPPLGPPPPPMIEDVPRVAFADLLADHCRFPVGDPRLPGFGFCGLPHEPGTPYCAGHLARCTSEVTDRQLKIQERAKMQVGIGREQLLIVAEYLEPVAA